MTTLAQVHARVEAPATVPLPFGLFSVAAPAAPGDHGLIGITWESWACVKPETTTDKCINGTTPADLDFNANCPPQLSYKPITVYAAIKRNGQSLEVGSEQVRRVLKQGEQYAVEKFLDTALAAAVTTPTAAASPLAALGTVEAALGDNYMGVGVIHMDRATATRLDAQLVRNGSRLETILGTPVVVGAGYAHGTPVIRGTGAVVVLADDVDTHSAWDMKINDELVLAQRTFLVGWDCYATGALVTPAT